VDGAAWDGEKSAMTALSLRCTCTDREKT